MALRGLSNVANMASNFMYDKTQTAATSTNPSAGTEIVKPTKSLNMSAMVATGMVILCALTISLAAEHVDGLGFSQAAGVIGVTGGIAFFAGLNRLSGMGAKDNEKEEVPLSSPRNPAGFNPLE